MWLACVPVSARFFRHRHVFLVIYFFFVKHARIESLSTSHCLCDSPLLLPVFFLDSIGFLVTSNRKGHNFGLTFTQIKCHTVCTVPDPNVPQGEIHVMLPVPPQNGSEIFRRKYCFSNVLLFYDIMMMAINRTLGTQLTTTACGLILMMSRKHTA